MCVKKWSALSLMEPYVNYIILPCRDLGFELLEITSMYPFSFQWSKRKVVRCLRGQESTLQWKNVSSCLPTYLHLDENSWRSLLTPSFLPEQDLEAAAAGGQVCAGQKVEAWAKAGSCLSCASPWQNSDQVLEDSKCSSRCALNYNSVGRNSHNCKTMS